jgi:tryptophanase
MTDTHPSELTRQTAADWLRHLLADKLVGACVEIDGRHLHVDVRVIANTPTEDRYRADVLAAQLWQSPEIAAVVGNVAGSFGLTLDQLRSRDRRPQLVRVRQAVMRALHEQAGLSSVQIGRLLDRDHTTVLHALRGRTHAEAN